MPKQYFDVFNGDADGISSLLQLRLIEPRQSILITGIKRDIKLLDRVNAKEGDHVTVLDISHDRNVLRLDELLKTGVIVDYYDHHKTGPIKRHKNLSLNINLSGTTCTSLIINKKFNGRFREWALVGAFGDNLNDVAQNLAYRSGYSDSTTRLLKELGIYLNYNSYGTQIADLVFSPIYLYEKAINYTSPIAFIENEHDIFDILSTSYKNDIEKSEQIIFDYLTDKVAVAVLPNETWAKRVSGVLGNKLANKFPDRAHAIVTEKNDGNYSISIRAPLNNRQNADKLAASFPSGGGRKAAAGINDLPRDNLNLFMQLMSQTYQ